MSLSVILVLNVIILLAAISINDVWGRRTTETRVHIKMLYGIVYGILAILLMILAWDSGSGVFYDARTVLIAVVSSMYSMYTTIVMVVIASIYRIYAGGVGVVPGVITILCTGLLGIGYKKFIYPKIKKNFFTYNLIFGFVIHIFMLLYHFALPMDLEFIFKRILLIFPIVLTFYPIAVAVLAEIIRYNDINFNQQDRLIESEKRYRILFNSVSTGILQFDELGIITDCNDRFVSILKTTREKVIGFDMNLLPSKRFKESLSLTLSGRESRFYGEYTSFLSGEKLFLDAMFNPILNEGLIQGGVGIVLDVTESETLRLDLERLYNIDNQTGLKNRKKFEEDIQSNKFIELFPIEYTILSIDNLQFYIDTLGYNESDKLLKDFVDCFDRIFDEEYSVYRISLNDFVVIHRLDKTKKIDISLENIKSNLKKFDYLPTPLFITHSTMVIEETDSVDWFDINNIVRERIRLKRIYSKSRITKNSIDILLATLFEKSPRERQHSERVSSLATKLGQAMNMDDDKLMRLRSSAVLHDIGKINIDSTLLDKPGKLSKDEFKIVRGHSESGSRILATVEDYKDLSQIVIAHHENYDGTGYPLGLKEEIIPIESRIISIVDAYDAMTNDRPYRKALTKNQAIKEIMSNAGTQFDPILADLFVTLIKKV